MPSGSKPGERRGGRKKGARNKAPGVKPKLSRREVEEIFLPPEAIGEGGQIVRSDPGGPYDPHYAGIEDPLELMLAIVRDDRIGIQYRMAAAKESLPYVRSRMAVAPYRPPDHDGRVIIEVVEFSEKDFE